MASLSIVTVRRICFDRDAWELKDTDIEVIEGVEFVKLAKAGANYGFTRLVCSGLEGLPNKVSLTMSKGYEELLEVRKAARIEEQKLAKLANIPEMFRSCSVVNMERVSKEERQHQRSSPVTMTIRVPGTSHNVVVKKPVCDREDLSVSIEGQDLTMLSHIHDFIRDQGFSESLKRPADLPKYVYKNKNSKYPFSFSFKVDGKRQRFNAKTRADAEKGAKLGPAAVERAGTPGKSKKKKGSMSPKRAPRRQRALGSQDNVTHSDEDGHHQGGAPLDDVSEVDDVDGDSRGSEGESEMQEADAASERSPQASSDCRT